MKVRRLVDSGVAMVALALAGLLVGAVAWVLGWRSAADLAWAVTTAIAVPPVAISLLQRLRHGSLGVDLIALLALGGALAYHQYVAGALISLMFATGQALEAYGGARARAELTALLARAPRTAHRYAGPAIETVPVDAIRRDDRLLVAVGEVLPVDGVVLAIPAVIDESALTGEAAQVHREPGERVLSGSVNAGAPFDLLATASAGESTYAGIVRLVRDAEASKAPFVRLADRYAVIFLPLTLVLSALAWILSGDPVRALAVLVVATPCPLLLAAPVAIVSGMSRAAAAGIIIKSGGALEALARAKLLFIDKTGTVTTGVPALGGTVAFGDLDPDTILRLAASLEQASSHVLAEAIAKGACERHLVLVAPRDVREDPGYGVRGLVDGRLVAVGRRNWVVAEQATAPNARAAEERVAVQGASTVFVAVDGTMAGMLWLTDPIRPDAAATIQALRDAGVRRVTMISGDHASVAARIGAALKVDAVLAEQSPADKIEAVRAARAEGTTVMVGDGINDAPALAAADVGVAMGARGATASSEAADVVLLVDRLDRLALAMAIARRSRGIAVQSVVAGMGLSLIAMAIAAAGWLPPAPGALLQEGIDIAVILNALRALQGEKPDEPRRQVQAPGVVVWRAR
ncbi:MAG TPA: heavy metal translocating P-type ATPase [Candidatus Dormibacteraeota bacterium]